MAGLLDLYPFIVAEINRAAHVIQGVDGKDFDLPPKTSEILTELRSSRVKMFNLARAEQQSHLGWHAYGAMHGYDALGIVHPVLIAELAEMHDIPLGIVSALRIRIRDEPAFMKGYILGPSPLLLDSSAIPISHEAVLNLLNSTQSGVISHSTPAMVRAAWAGASNGWWDAEKLLLLPPMFGIDQETAMGMMTNAMGEPSVTLA